MTARGLVIYVALLACVPGALTIIIAIIDIWNSLYREIPNFGMVVLMLFYLIVSDLAFTIRVFYGEEEW